MTVSYHTEKIDKNGGSGCGERGEDEGVTWEPCFTGRVISEDRDSVCRT